MGRAVIGKHRSTATPEQSERARFNLAAEAVEQNAAEDLHGVLEALGLSTREGEVLVRFGQHASQVRVYVDPDGDLACMFCELQPGFHTMSKDLMLEHLRSHRRAGHAVPMWVDERVVEWHARRV